MKDKRTRDGGKENRKQRNKDRNCRIEPQKRGH
jgi:hypothetical protein